jgi:C1A family cysteine protease
MVARKINFGWLPDHPDHRDLPFKGMIRSAEQLPSAFDIRQIATIPHPLDQGDLGSCVANATAAAMMYERAKARALGRDDRHADTTAVPSRLFLYYGAREILGTVNEDSGAMIRDAMKVAYTTGVPVETSWPYNIDKFTNKPPARSYSNARYHKITGYRSVPVNIQEIKKALAEGLSIVAGISVYSSFPFEGPPTVPMPGPNDYMEGGHAILLVGYDDSTQQVTFRNSWGVSWGNAGYGSLPYAYIGDPNYGDDYWAVIDDQYKERMNE